MTTTPEVTANAAEFQAILADPAFEERYWKLIDKRGPDECWEYVGRIKARPAQGYGRVTASGYGRMRANRAAWLLANNKPIPDGFYVCHTCDNPACCNPAHLWAGSPTENVHDMIRKGRRVIMPYSELARIRVPRGEQKSLAKLTDIQVMILRRAVIHNAALVARNMGLGEATVSQVLSGKRWKHIPWPEGAGPRGRKEASHV